MKLEFKSYWLLSFQARIGSLVNPKVFSRNFHIGKRFSIEPLQFQLEVSYTKYLHRGEAEICTQKIS